MSLEDIQKVLERLEHTNLVIGKKTGAAAIYQAIGFTSPIRLLSLDLLLSAAGTTTENFTITKNSRINPVYDAVIYSRDLSVGAVTSLYLKFGEGYEYLPPAKDCSLLIEWPNTETRTYGITYRYELI